MLPAIYLHNVQKIMFKYFVLWDTQKDKRVDLRIYFSNLQIVSDFVIFVYPTIQRTSTKFYMFVDYTIYYVQICFHIFFWNLQI
jgi:hypothetical protein